MAYRANVTDRDQTVLETAAFEDGIPVHENATTRVVARGSQTGAERTNKAGVAVVEVNAGVIMPWNDQPGKFMENQGKPS